MDVYVAGVNIPPEHENKTLQEKTRLISNLLEKIDQDAKIKSGEDALVIVIMQEYALTPMAVSNADKKKSLAALQHAVEKYPNMMLIPGTYAAQEHCTNKERKHAKINKLAANYENLVASKIVPIKTIAPYLKGVNQAITNESTGNFTFLQNSAYILTATSKFKHKKSAPTLELKKMRGDASRGVYYIGADDFVKEVDVNGRSIDTGIFICLEHSNLQYHHLSLEEHPPVLQVIVSDWIPLNKNKLFGALNVQMDSKKGLRVMVNTKHSHGAEIEKVKAYVYSTDNLLQHTQSVPTEFFARQVGQAPAVVKLNKHSGLYRPEDPMHVASDSGKSVTKRRLR